MSKQKWLPGLLVLLVGLAACDGGAQRETARQSASPAPTITPDEPVADAEGLLVADLPAPSNGGLVLPDLIGLDGGLIVAKGGKLWLSWFGDEEPVLLAAGVAPSMIEPSPDGRAVVYAMQVMKEDAEPAGGPLADRYEYRLTVTHLDTLARVDLTAVGNPRRMYAMLVGWSPDSQTVLTWNSSALIATRVDRQNVQAVAGQPSVAWLADSTMLIIAPENLMTPGAPLAVYRFDPQAGLRSTRVRISLDAAPDFLQIAGVLAARGLYFDPFAFHDFHRAAPLPDGSWAYIEWSDAVKQMNAPLCASWELRRTQPGSVLYTSPDTTFLSDLTALPDGSLLFLRWTLNQCRFLGGMRVELVRLVPGEEPEVITGDIDPGDQANPNLVSSMGYWRAHKYAVTTDGRFVFWIGKSDVEGVSLIHVTDLQEHVTAALLADVVLPDGAGQFEGVYWVPRPVDGEQE